MAALSLFPFRFPVPVDVGSSVLPHELLRSSYFAFFDIAIGVNFNFFSFYGFSSWGRLVHVAERSPGQLKLTYLCKGSLLAESFKLGFERLWGLFSDFAFSQ